MDSEQGNRDNKGSTINPPREPAQRGRRRKSTGHAKNCPDNEAAGCDEFLLSVAQSCSLVEVRQALLRQLPVGAIQDIAPTGIAGKNAQALIEKQQCLVIHVEE